MAPKFTEVVVGENTPGDDDSKDQPIVLRRSGHLPFYFISGYLKKSLLKALESELSFVVQGHEYSEKYQTGEWDGKELLLYSTKKTGIRYFPAGLLDKVRGILDAFDEEYTVDYPPPTEPIKLKLSWKSHITLYPDQQEAIDAAIGAGFGTICMPTGTGKTVVAMAIMNVLKVKTLIVVHRKELVKQWVIALRETLGYDPGIVGSGKETWKDITIAMVQSMQRKKSIPKEFDLIILDECFPYDTLVQTDIGILQIGEIVEERLPVKVLTHSGQYKRVLNYVKKPMPKEMVCVIHEFGNFKCTKNHKILTNAGWKRAETLISGDVLYLEHDMRWDEVSLQNLWKGVSDAKRNGGACKCCACTSGAQWEFDQETVVGCVSRGSSGSCEGDEGQRKHVAARGCIDTGTAPDDSGKFVGRHEYNVSEWKEFVSQNHRETFFKTSRVYRLEIFDSEKFGTYPSQTRGERGVGENELCISHENDANVRRDLQFVVSRGEECCFRSIPGTDNNAIGFGRVVPGRRIFDQTEGCCAAEGIGSLDCDIPGESSRSRMQNDTCVATRGVGIFILSESEQERIGSFSSSERGGNDILGTDKCSNPTGVHEIQDTAGFYVYDLEIEEDHTYTANGAIVHNCHHTPARSAYQLAMKCNATFRYGLSATPTRTDGAELKMFAAVGEIIYKSKPESAIKKGRIVRPEFRFIETIHPRNVFQGMPFHEAYTLGITTNEDRNNKIVSQANMLLQEGHTVYIHVEEVAHGKWIAGHIPEAGFVCGEDKKKIRDKLIDDFSEGKTKILVSTLLGEGVNIPSITAIIMAGGKKSESGCIQKIGRALRTLPGKEKAIVVDFKDKGAYLYDHWQERYSAYKKFYGKYCQDL